MRDDKQVHRGPAHCQTQTDANAVDEENQGRGGEHNAVIFMTCMLGTVSKVKKKTNQNPANVIHLKREFVLTSRHQDHREKKTTTKKRD